MAELGLVWAARSFYEYKQEQGHKIQVAQLEPLLNLFTQGE
jgi:hypothetical protein